MGFIIISNKRTITSSSSRFLINTYENTLTKVMRFYKTSIKFSGHGKKLTALVTQGKKNPSHGEVSTAESPLVQTGFRTRRSAEPYPPLPG